MITTEATDLIKRIQTLHESVKLLETFIEKCISMEASEYRIEAGTHIGLRISSSDTAGVARMKAFAENEKTGAERELLYTVKQLEAELSE